MPRSSHPARLERRRHLSRAFHTLGHVTLLLTLLETASVTMGAAQLPPAGDPPYIPTPQSLVDTMLEMAGVGPGDILYDLGSGDGRVVITAAKRGASGVGVEYVEWLVHRSMAGADSAGVGDRTTFVHGDVFEADVHDATVVTLYLGAEFNARLRPRLLEQLRPGSRVVSHGFHMGEWEPDRTRTVGDGASRASLFYWVVPADLDGFWSLEIENLPASVLELRQEFQMLTVVGGGSGETGATTGRVLGEAVRFEAELGAGVEGTTFQFQGRLEDGKLVGYLEGEDGSRRTWRAVRFTDLSLAPG
jgi:hypothetical protein